MTTEQLYASYQEKMQRIADIRYATAVLQWDQETHMPAGGAHYRGQQISTLTELSHDLFSKDDLGGLLQDLLAKEGLSAEQKRNVELTLEDYTKNKKYPSSFVRQLSDQINQTFHAWIEARKANSFTGFQQDLEKLVQFKKQETDILGYEGHPYNALLNEFEKGATATLLDTTFQNLLPALQEVFNRIISQPQVDNSFLFQQFPKDAQWSWGMYLIKELHYNMESGRQDLSEHPFSISFNPQDVRITTRVDEHDFGNMTWSCIHEVGHALYEQGLPTAHYGLPLGEACSYSIHESQSRLWENNVGRGKAFWQHYFPKLQTYFPQQFGNTNLDVFYKGINKVQPSLIRTEADEISYHFHVYIRYELEKRLIEGTLPVADIPTFWKEHYQKLLQVQVPDDKSGSLQDVHWSHGSFGYFPTYSLGSFYAAQFYATAQAQVSGLEIELSSGQSQSLLKWLRENVHSSGRYYTSEELCKRITGKGLDVSYFMQYITKKYATIYNF